MRIPQRASLVEETAAVLKEGIAGGRWLEVLPGEHQLCAEMHISRTTLRKALESLFRQGLLGCGGHGRRHRVLAGGRKTPGTAAANPWCGKEIRILSALPVRELVSLTQTALEHFHSELEAAGYTYQFDYCPWLKGRRAAAELKRLTDQAVVAAWALLGASEQVQRWFEGTGLPGIVFGTRFPGIRVPSAEFASGAVGRHAGMEFLRRGHTRIALMHPAMILAGDAQCGDGLREVASQPPAAAEVIDGAYEPSARGIRRAMERLLARAKPPTAYFVTQPNFVWPVLGCLQQAGWAVPGDAAVISRGDDLFLATSVPEVARYGHDGVRLGKAAARLVLATITGGSDATTSRTVMPEFIPGETLGPVPAKPQ
ncbi:MAG: substrate-binding domain-containing protein [Verrucomicrobia bacterium]|nr:substrate-binding domain-containing protein [Verrucomicrobiota bacterium]